MSPGLADVARVLPDPALRMVRAADSLGDLPDGYTLYHYPDVAFAGDTDLPALQRGLLHADRGRGRAAAGAPAASSADELVV